MVRLDYWGFLFVLVVYGTSFALGDVCYGELGCFSPRPECGEDSRSPDPDTPAHVDTTFFLYTSKSQSNGKLLDYNMGRSDFIGAGFDTSVQTKVLIHGFNNDGNSPAVQDIKDAFLNTGKYNVIIVQWNTGIYYPQALQDLRLVAKQLELLVRQLKSEVGVSYGNLHLIGHSLGAHTVGLTGALLSGNVGRITGLDPAGPDFESVEDSCRISKSDAGFVDIIHTDTISYGTDVESGDIDFWPNDGKNQPGCGVSIDGCDHGRCTEYFAISILGSCDFSTYACGSSSCSNCPQMGINADRSSKRGNFCLTTTSNYPYC